MSTSELRRAGVLARVAAGTLTLGSAAALMDVSYRQAKRVYRRYRAEGANGLKHRSAGRPSNRATAAKVRERVLALIREKYSGGGRRAVWADVGRRAPGERRRAHGRSRNAAAVDAGGGPLESGAETQSASPPAGAEGAFRRARAARWQFPSMV